jgi:hypothetical protein
VTTQPQTAPASLNSWIRDPPSDRDGIVEVVAIQVAGTEASFEGVPTLVRQLDACEFRRPAVEYSDFALGCCELFFHQVEQLGQEPCDEFGIGTTVLARVAEFFEHKA